MKNLISIEEIEELKKSKMAILYFTGIDCGACEAIKMKVEQILKKYPEINSGEVDGEKHLELAAMYEAFSLPLFILYIEGKETLRLGRNVDLMDLEKHIDRYYNLLFD